jgi:hypothetical protein
LLRSKDFGELVQETPLVDFEDEVFVEIDFAEELEDVFSVDCGFEEFNEHGNESFLEEGVEALDAVSDDFDDDGVFRLGGFVGEGFLEDEFEELNGEFVIEDNGFAFLFVTHRMVEFEEFGLEDGFEVLDVGRNEGVFPFEEVDEFEGNFQFNKFFDVVVMLVDCGSDTIDGFHELFDLLAGGHFVIQQRRNELGMFLQGGDRYLLVLL